MSYDICIVGHVTEDLVEIAGERPKSQPGGTVFYASVAAKRLGMHTAIVTRMNPDDRQKALPLMESLGIDVHVWPSPVTTRFVNIYPEANPDTRIQRVEAVAHSFVPEDLDVASRLYLFGPLTKDELPVDCLRRVRKGSEWVALDVQGLMREVRDQKVYPFSNPHLFDYLKEVDVLKASREEAMLVTGATTMEEAARRLSEAGPGEVVITAGSKGSIIRWEGDLFEVPAIPPVSVVDSTGCGDTYFAAYLSRRLLGDTPQAAGSVAAYVAAAKIAYHGPFRGQGTNGAVLKETGSVESTPPRPER